MQTKKGIQLNQAVGAVLTLVGVAVLVIIAVYLLSGMSNTLVTPNTSGTSVNESLARPTTAGITLTTGSSARDGVCGTITAVYNTTNDRLISAGNYTQVGCVVTNKTSDATLGATWKFNYPYTYSAATAASNATDTTIVNFSGYPALIGLVGTIIFLGIVIGVLVASFVFGKKEGA
jgi:hypothetical protein